MASHKTLDVSETHIISALFIFFLLFLFALRLFSQSRSKKDYLYFDGDTSCLANGLASAGMFAGVLVFFLLGLIFQNGFDGLLPSLALLGGLIIFSFIFSSAESCSQAKTIPQFLALRFGNPVHILALFISSISVYGLLLVCFSNFVIFTSHFFSLSLSHVSLITAFILGLLVVPSGLKSVLRTSVSLYLVFVIFIFGFLCYASFDLYGYFLPQIGVLPAEQDVAKAEEVLIEKGLVDFGLFKPFLNEFLTVDRLNWFLLTLSIMAGLSVFPPLLQINATGRSFSEIHKSISWALFAIILPLTALPFVAAIVRIEIYRCATLGTTFSEIPQWVLLASERDIIRIHGVSVSLVKKVSSILKEEALNKKNMAVSMSSLGEEQSESWRRLDEKVQIAILEVAKRYSSNIESSTSSFLSRQLKEDFVHVVLPIAANAAGNYSQKINYSAFDINLHGLLFVLPQLEYQSVYMRALFELTLFGVGLCLMAFLTVALANMIVYDGQDLFPRVWSPFGNPINAARLMNAALLTLTALLASKFQFPSALIVVGCLSFLAITIFPAVLLGQFFSPANTVGCLAGMAAGVFVFIYYFLGTSIFSVPFYETWFWLSTAGFEGYDEFKELKAFWLSVAGEEKIAAYKDLLMRTSGSLWSPGLANWFGIAPASIACISIPSAVTTGMIISLLTNRLYSRKKGAL